MFDPFVQFGLILLVVLAVSIFMRLLKQPLIIGYIFSGIIVGPVFFNFIHSNETLNVFAEMGIAFLLFIVGLHLSPKVIKEVGKVSLVTGLGQIFFTCLVGYLLSLLLGFSIITSLYIAIALTFSSTIIIMKLLSDQDSLDKLFGKISIGFLLVQDLVAILILIVVSSLNNGGGVGSVLGLTVLKGVIVTCALIFISYYILPKLGDFVAKLQEFLFIFAISWGFGLSLLFYHIGFSIEVGALIAGVMLSMSPYSHEISSKLKPLRDFFIISFFIILGSQMVFADISHLLWPAVILSIFILVGNPLIVVILMGALGYRKKTGFMAGLTVAQISEFSLILIAMGVKVGSLTQEVLSFVTVIGLITIAGSSYMIIYSEKIFSKCSKFLNFFEKKNIKEKSLSRNNYDYVLLGYNRIGFSILRSLKKITDKFLVVDYNPSIVKELRQRGIKTIYGDVEDLEFLEDLKLTKASVIISTIPDMDSNKLIMEVVKRGKNKNIVILTARQINDALDLYELGASYVILPHFLGGEYVSRIIRIAKDRKTKYKIERNKELKILKQRIAEGHQHPQIEKK